MNKWEMVRLGDVCHLNMGQSPESSSYNQNGEGLPFYQGNADFGDINPIARYWCSQPKKQASDGDILISVRAPIGALNFANEICCIGRGLAALTAKQNISEPRYIYYVLKSKHEELNSKGTGSTFKAISKKILEETLFPLPPLPVQKQIADTLDKASRLIDLRKQQLEKMDLLVKSKFIEMFGDEENFTKELLSENVVEMFIGPFGSSLKNDCFVDFENSYCMVYEQKHAIRKTMDVETRYVSEKKYRELKRFSVYPNDIIVSCRGTIGETFIVPDNAPMGIMHPSIMKIRLSQKSYNIIFFEELLKQCLQKHKYKAEGSGIKMAITASELGGQLFPVPPLPLQTEFASFVERVEAQKSLMLHSLSKMEMNYKALMQEYFG